MRDWRVTWQRRKTGALHKRRFYSEWEAVQFAECLSVDDRANPVTVENTRTGDRFYR